VASLNSRGEIDMPIKSVIRAVAHNVPERVVANAELAELMTTSNEWIVERTGIEQRRFIDAAGMSTTDVAIPAIDAVLAKCGYKATDIDMIVASTLSPDLYFPGIGTLIQHRIGASTIPALDIRAQCSGLVYGLSTCDAFIRSGQAKRILLVCAEVQSPALDLTDRGRDMAVLFGDGAGALIIEAENCDELPSLNNKERGIISSALHSDGSGAEVLCLRSPGTATKGFLAKDTYDSGDWHPQMDGKAVFKNAVVRLGEVAEELLSAAKGGVSDIELLLPHQANLRINEMVRERLGLSESQVFNTIQRYGNTTSATIPIGMSEAEDAGILRQGMVVMTIAFGAGFTWGGNLIRW
jgi:3-oxoacyl-[acyl-carrier-protein] synthase III